MTASTSSTLRPTTAGTLVAGFPRGRFYASPGTRVLSFSRASSTTLPADALRGPGPLGAREGAGDVAAGRIERSARPLPVAGAGLDQAAQRLVCGAAPRAVLYGYLIARQADRPVDVADGTGPTSSRTPYPAAKQAGPQVLRAPVATALSSPPPDPLPGLAAALRGLTHEAARFPQLIIIYDQIPDRRRGRGFATGIHLNEALEWSKRPGPPHGAGQTWRVHSVQNTRHYYHLPNHRNDDTWLTIEQAAARLGVSHTVVKRLIRQQTLPATQVVASTPWIINRQDLDLPAVQAEIEAVRGGRQLRRTDPNQARIPLETGLLEKV